MGNWNQWSDETTEQLKVLWASGLSASRIACQIPNSTRNSILGKVHRLALTTRRALVRTPPVARKRTLEEKQVIAARLKAYRTMAAYGPTLAPINGKARHMKPRLWKARHASPVPAPAYEGEPKLITELPAGRGCRYAVTDDKPFRFCGAPGYPWCEHHKAIVWRPL